MPELRKDIITREWVVIASDRVKRPGDFNINILPLRVRYLSAETLQVFMRGWKA